MPNVSNLMGHNPESTNMSPMRFNRLSLPEKYRILVTANRAGILSTCAWWEQLDEQNRKMLIDYNQSVRKNIVSRSTRKLNQISKSLVSKKKINTSKMYHNYSNTISKQSVSGANQGSSEEDLSEQPMFIPEFLNLIDVYGNIQKPPSTLQFDIQRKSRNWIRRQVAAIAVKIICDWKKKYNIEKTQAQDKSDVNELHKVSSKMETSLHNPQATKMESLKDSPAPSSCMTRQTSELVTSKAPGLASSTWRHYEPSIDCKNSKTVRHTSGQIVDRVCKRKKTAEAVGDAREIKDVVKDLIKDVVARRKTEKLQDKKDLKIQKTVQKCIDDLVRKVSKSVAVSRRNEEKRKLAKKRRLLKESEVVRKRVRKQLLAENRAEAASDAREIKDVMKDLIKDVVARRKTEKLQAKKDLKIQKTVQKCIDDLVQKVSMGVMPKQDGANKVKFEDVLFNGDTVVVNIKAADIQEMFPNEFYYFEYIQSHENMTKTESKTIAPHAQNFNLVCSVPRSNNSDCTSTTNLNGELVRKAKINERKKSNNQSDFIKLTPSFSKDNKTRFNRKCQDEICRKRKVNHVCPKAKHLKRNCSEIHDKTLNTKQNFESNSAACTNHSDVLQGKERQNLSFASPNKWFRRLSRFNARTLNMNPAEYLYFSGLRTLASFTRGKRQYNLKKFANWISKPPGPGVNGSLKSSSRKLQIPGSNQMPEAESYYDADAIKVRFASRKVVHLFDFLLCDQIAQILENPPYSGKVGSV